MPAKFKKTQAEIGDTIRITEVQYHSNLFRDGIDHQAKDLIGKTGIVEHIDSAGNLIGTWGGLAILPEDKYEIIERG